MEIDSKVALLDAAGELFAQRGFEGTSVKDICEKAGVNVSLVSYHFEGKEGLYRSVLARFAEHGLEVAERLLTPAQSKEEFLVRLKMFCEEMMVSHVRHPHQTRILHRECTGAFPVAKELFQQTFQRVFERFLQFLAAGRTAKFVRADLDPMIAASFFFGSISHFCNTDSVRKELFKKTIHDEAFRAEAVDQLVQIFVRGVL